MMADLYTAAVHVLAGIGLATLLDPAMLRIRRGHRNGMRRLSREYRRTISGNVTPRRTR